MRCPKCSFNQKKSRGMICGNCAYQFVFDPKDSADGHLSDGWFNSVVMKASANDTRYFTANQLYSLLRRKKADKFSWRRLNFFLFLVVLCSVLFSFPTVKLMVAVLVGVNLLRLAMLMFKSPALEHVTFERLLPRWQASELGSDKLIVTPALHEPPPEYSEKDIYDYGVECILVVDNDMLVDLLVKNDWHAENRTLVVAINRYPEYIWDLMERILHASPQVPVYFLHNPSKKGRLLKALFVKRHPDLTSGRPMFDFGLHPRALRRLQPRRWLGSGVSEENFQVDYLPVSQLLPFLAFAVATPQTFEQWYKDQVTTDSYSNYG